MDPVEAFQPSGPPDVSAARHGMIVELWLSSTQVAQGDLVEALVRINVQLIRTGLRHDRPVSLAAADDVGSLVGDRTR